MTRPAKSARSEHHLQSAIVTHCNGLLAGMVRGRYAAIPNGGKYGTDRRNAAIEAGKLRAEGLRPGMPDMVFWREPGRVLWVEVKNGTGGRLSPEQRSVHAALLRDGHEVVVVRDLAGACEVIIGFFRS